MSLPISKWVATDATYRPDRYYPYDELTELLHTWVQEYPQILAIESIGKTYEQRNIWALTLTNTATGPAEDKPAAYVDANIHAGEVTGCATVLWLLNHILTSYGEDDRITNLVDSSVLYLVPAIMLDGMNLYLTTPDRLRSSVRHYPESELQDGLQREDLNGDGRILHMRLASEHGPWKKHPDDSRVMIAREPDEVGGEYFFVFEEGTIRNWDGGAIRPAIEKYGLDLNRNFPHQWAPEWVQRGAGVLPLSESETRAMAEFLTNHPNIGTTQHFHTWSAVILRSAVNRPDTALPNFDLAMYKLIGKMGTEETGYPCVSIHDGFRYDKHKQMTGGVQDWVYETFGAYAYSTELWSLPRKAGVEVSDFIEWGNSHEPGDDLAMAKAIDEYADGEGLFAWEPFDHPQLGEVEIGGWDYKFAIQNPPGSLLEEVTAGNARFVLRQLSVIPRLVVEDVKAESIGEGVYHVSALVRNVGFLPTYLSDEGKKISNLKGVRAELSGNGLDLVSGKREIEVGHLDGRANVYGPLRVPSGYGDLARSRVEWVVRGEAGDELSLTVSSTKAGTVRTSLSLPGQ